MQDKIFTTNNNFLSYVHSYLNREYSPGLLLKSCYSRTSFMGICWHFYCYLLPHIPM